MGVVEEDYFDILRDAGVLDDDDELISEEDEAINRLKKRAKKARSAGDKKIVKKIIQKAVKKKKRPDSYDDPNWHNRLLRKEPRKTQAQGDILSNAHNAALIFSCDPRWKGVLAFDELLGDIVTLKPPPWHADVAPRTQKQGEWTDSDTARAEVWLTREFKFSSAISSVRAALQITAERHSFHPVRRWLKSLEWDQETRLDDYLIRLCGAKDTPYVRAVGKNFLIGAVARAMEPGVQVDSMPVFEGDQGAGKSSMLRALGGPWFMETTIQVGDKDSYQVLKGMWIVEWGEMGSMTRSEVNLVKQYISERISRYRPSFGSRVMDFPRQCVFAGTCNPSPSGYLKDETGARRFWPVKLGQIDLEALREERKQLFAEAYARYLEKEAFHFKDEAIIKEHREEAEERRQVDPWEGLLVEWLCNFSEQERFDGVTTHLALLEGLRVGPSQMTRGDEMRCASVLRTLGWTFVKKRYEGRATVRAFCPDGPDATPMSKGAIEKTRLERMSVEERKKYRAARKEERKASKTGKLRALQGGKVD